jgi:ribose 5-phosphate isomerase B
MYWQREHRGDDKRREPRDRWPLYDPVSKTTQQPMSSPTKPIAVGADDAAFELKGKIVDYLKSKGIPVEDYGVNNPDPAILYPDVALSVAQAVAAGKHDRGILMCGTGIGVAITANKVPGIRAAVCHDSYSAERSRKSND